MTLKNKGILSVMVPVIVWGISFVNTEYLLGFLGPITIGGVRFIIATIMLYGLMRFTKQPLKIDKEHRKLFAIAGFVGIALYFYFENTGVLYISAGPASLIMAAIPILSLITETVVYKRRIDVIDFLAVATSIVGVTFIVGFDLKSLLFTGDAKGYLMMLGAALSWVVYSFVSKPLFKRYSYLTIIFYQFLYSIPFFVPFFFLESNHWEQINGEGLFHLMFLSVFASVLGFYFYAKSMDLLGVTESSLFINFQPIATIVVAYFYTGKICSLNEFIGGCIIMASVTVTTLRSGQPSTITNPLET